MAILTSCKSLSVTAGIFNVIPGKLTPFPDSISPEFSADNSNFSFLCSITLKEIVPSSILTDAPSSILLNFKLTSIGISASSYPNEYVLPLVIVIFLFFENLFTRNFGPAKSINIETDLLIFFASVLIFFTKSIKYSLS